MVKINVNFKMFNCNVNENNNLIKLPRSVKYFYHVLIHPKDEHFNNLSVSNKYHNGQFIDT